MLVACQDVSVAYEGGVALKDVSFGGSGDYLASWGERLGKSTLLMKALLGPRACADGAVLTGGGLSRTNGYMPQQTGLMRISRQRGRLCCRAASTAASAPGIPGRARPRPGQHGKAGCGGRAGEAPLPGALRRSAAAGALTWALCATTRLIVLDEPPPRAWTPWPPRNCTALIGEISGAASRSSWCPTDVRAAVRYATIISAPWRQPLFFGIAEGYRRAAGRLFLGWRMIDVIRGQMPFHRCLSCRSWVSWWRCARRSWA